jgi:hypothetical protein
MALQLDSDGFFFHNSAQWRSGTSAFGGMNVVADAHAEFRSLRQLANKMQAEKVYLNVIHTIFHLPFYAPNHLRAE